MFWSPITKKNIIFEKVECNDCANGAAMAWPELYQEYVLMAENIQDRAYYQSKDEKWALSWSSSGWGLGAADQLGKKDKNIRQYVLFVF